MTAETKIAVDPALLNRILGKDREESDLRQSASAIAVTFEKSVAASLTDILPSVPAFSLQKLDIGLSTKDPPKSDVGSVVVLLREVEGGPRCGLLFDDLALATLTNALLGADPEEAVEKTGRPANEFELELISLLAKHLGEALTEALRLTQTLRTTETLPGPQFAGHAAAAQRFVSLDFSVGPATSAGQLKILLPVKFVKDAAQDSESTGEEADQEWNSRFKSSVMQVRLPLTVKIDLPMTTLGAIEDWKCGDVVEFAQPGRGTAEIFVGEKHLFEGELGRIGETYTVRLTAEAKTEGGARKGPARSGN